MRNFSLVLSNPPYQDGSNRPLFQLFQTVASCLSPASVMVYPARWWHGALGLEEFKQKTLGDKSLESVIYYDLITTTNHVFPETGIAGGVCVVRRGLFKRNDFVLEDGFKGDRVLLEKGSSMAYPLAVQEISLINKVLGWMDKENVPTLRARGQFKLNELGLTAEQLKSLNATPLDSKEGLPDGMIRFYGNLEGGKGGRSAWYCLKPPPHFTVSSAYKVCFGQSILENDARPLRLFMFDPDTTFGRSSVALAYFSTEAEAREFLEYASTPLFEKLFRLSLGGRFKTMGMFVPDLMAKEENWRELFSNLEDYLSLK